MTKFDENDESIRESIFEIMDGLLSQLRNTKKIFIVMMLSVIILPAMTLLVGAILYDVSAQDIMILRIQKQLENGKISQEEFDREYEYISTNADGLVVLRPQIVVITAAVVWLTIGILQWFKLSKWDKKYQIFKQEQDEIDKDFDETSKN